MWAWKERAWKERAWREWIDMSGETNLFNFEIWGFVFQVVVDKGEASEREKEETNTKEDEKFNAKEDEKLNAKEEEKLPVRWSLLGEEEEGEQEEGGKGEEEGEVEKRVKKKELK